MERFVNPQIATLRAQLQEPIQFLQVEVRKESSGFLLRHVADRERPLADLQVLTLDELAPWADSTLQGTFRPNKAAPSLRTGWRCHAANEADLAWALDQLYPGALADWHAWETGTAVITSFRDFMARQTGMYRGTQNLTDTQADQVATAGCDSSLCLRRRCWPTPGLDTAPAGSNLSVPCLEPCALLLEFARWTARQSREPIQSLPMTEADRQTLVGALEQALAHPRDDVREGDTRNPSNPRRLLHLWHRLRADQSGSKPNNEA
jgi:4Fe-4S iron-sulfur cluster binding domain/DR2241 stabilising domain